MAAKENLRTRLAKTGAAVQLRTHGLAGAAEAAMHFLLSAVLAGGQILDGYAPFGLAMVGASGSGLNAAAAMVGAGFGYLTLMGMPAGLRYVSASILTFSAAFAFYDVKFYRLPWTMPAVAAAMDAFTGLVYLSRWEWNAGRTIGFVLEILLTALSAYGFRAVLQGGKKQKEARLERISGALLLAGAALVSLAKLHLFAGISLGGMLAAAAVLALAWRSGAGTGAAAGVALGLALDLAAAGSPRYAMAFGAAGVAAGLFRGRRRLASAAAFVLGDAAAVLWTWSQDFDPAILYEVFAASVIFLLLPARALQLVGAAAPEAAEAVDSPGKDQVRERLEETAAAFRALYDTMRAAFRRPPANDSDTAAVFDRSADRVCRRCSLRSVCWERDYVTTFNALNDALQTMMDRGRGTPGDFPGYFSSRCIHFPAFLEAVNEELTALLYRRQYNSRIRESREAVCRQYGQLSDLLRQAASELGDALTPDPVQERRLRQHLAARGLEGDAAVCRDSSHRLRVEVSGPDCQCLRQPEELSALGELLGVPMRPAEGKGDGLLLVQAEPLMALAGIAARKKDGETVSGDAGTWFKRPDGTLYVLLCDGMGSGPAANRESSLAVRLLEQFLQAGVETENALVILSSALGLRGEEEGGFTTVDLLQVDLFDGEAAVFKFGAAPTYIKKGRSVQRVTGSALPAGLSSGGSGRPDCVRLRLEPGDCVLMASDGVCGAQDDGWLRRRLEDFTGEDPKELARALVHGGPEAADDRTALVMCIARREIQSTVTASPKKAQKKEQKRRGEA